MCAAERTVCVDTVLVCGVSLGILLGNDGDVDVGDAEP